MTNECSKIFFRVVCEFCDIPKSVLFFIFKSFTRLVFFVVCGIVKIINLRIIIKLVLTKTAHDGLPPFSGFPANLPRNNEWRFV